MEQDRKYEKKVDLPETLRKVLPDRAQEVYLEGYRRGWEMYNPDTTDELDQQSSAHRQGWAAVREEFRKNEETGEWIPKDAGPTEEEEEKGLLDKLEDAVT